MRNINFWETFQTLGDVHNSFKIIWGTSKKVLKFYKFYRIVFRMSWGKGGHTGSHGSYGSHGSHGEHMAPNVQSWFKIILGTSRKVLKFLEKF